MAVHKLTLTCLCGKIHGETEITDEGLKELERIIEQSKKNDEYVGIGGKGVNIGE